MGDTIRLKVDPGICGFWAEVEAERVSKEEVRIRLNHSQCKHVQKLVDAITAITLRDLFVPITQNRVYMAAKEARCHPSCVVPVAIIKACEVALEVALPKDVSIKVDEK